ncbi:(2Fe-2S) ferredoxin domain-containing protein [Candidatus Woesearchaeota archaeon]|nr:(2Fe-2S) ferredoxin domain-containing protein [Candidatus Woesearchaeota archaeon]
MEPLPVLNPRKHVFVCTNKREPEKSCCSHVGGEEIFYALKDYVKSHGLASRVWVTRTGCLGFCNNKGTSIVVYPDQKWFLQVTKEDLHTIIDIINQE